MSRTILDITLRLSDGRTLTGRGRNLPATIERIYNEPNGGKSGARVRLAERFKTGHVKKGEQRYNGTFHATFTTPNEHGETIREDVAVEVKQAAATRNAPVSAGQA